MSEDLKSSADEPEAENPESRDSEGAVSYTHLTLPTILLV